MADAGLATSAAAVPIREGDLVARLRQGDLSAFEDLVRPYERRTYRAIIRITRDPTEAADVYQDTLITAVEKVDAFRGEAAFGSWLFRIAVNCALMRHRARRDSRVVLESDLPRFDWMGRHARPVADWVEPAEAQVHRAELRAALEAALGSLSAIDRAIVWLKDAEGESHESIAETTGLSVPATRSRLHRARLFLRSKLAEFAGGGR